MKQHTLNQIQFGQASIDYTKIIFLLIIISAIIGISVIVFTSITPKKAVCGDNVCSSSENCYDCPQDCKCGSNTYCDATKKTCVASICGNRVCEPFENIENCCEDCGCPSAYQICNMTTHKCQMPQATISDERVKELATEYFANKSETISSFGLITSTVYQNNLGKSVVVYLQGEMGIIHILIVTDDEQVYERPIT